MSKNCGTTLSFVAGIALGAFAGMFFSPEKGERMRSVLKYKLKTYKAGLKELLEDLIHHKPAISNKAKEASQKVVKDAKNKAEKLLKSVDELMVQFEGN